jgi:hypothetical protein
VLGHLPVWTEDEDAFQATELEAGATESIRSYGLSEFTARLASDRGTPSMDEAQIQALLEGLQVQGLASQEQDQWSMTKAGYDLLTGAPASEPANLVGASPGPAVVELHEAQNETGGEA